MHEEMIEEMRKKKKSTVLYYDYVHNEFEELELEEIGALCLGILQFDMQEELREDAQKLLDDNKLLRVLYKEMKTKTEKATQDWCEKAKAAEERKKNKNITNAEEREKNKNIISELFMFECYDTKEAFRVEYKKGDRGNIEALQEYVAVYKLTTKDVKKIIELGNAEKWEKDSQIYAYEVTEGMIL